MMKTSELTGALLDLWVARAEGWQLVGEQDHSRPRHTPSKDFPGETYEDWNQKGPHKRLEAPDGERVFFCGCQSDTTIPQFSSDWAYGGPIIEKMVREMKFGISPAQMSGPVVEVSSTDGDGIPYDNNWDKETVDQCGDSVLEAAMRAFVASKFGDTVPDAIG